MTKSLNKADKTFLLASVLFLFFLALHLNYPSSIVADCLLFVSEAALVGGFADWFAVKALFEKPLGIPFHTALIPKRRQELIEATTTMIEQEFFSRKKIISHLKQFGVYSAALNALKSSELKDEILKHIIAKVRETKGDGKEFTIVSLKEKFPEIILEILADLKESGKDRALLKRLIAYLTELAKADSVKELIYEAFKRFGTNKAQDVMNSFLGMIAQSTGIVDFEEGAKIFQAKIVKFFEEFSNSFEMQNNLLNLIHEKLYSFMTAKRYAVNRAEWINAIFSALSVEKIVDDVYENVETKEIPALLSEEYDGMINLIERDAHIHNIFEHLIYDILARSALYAQGKMGDIVNDAISALSDDELNRIIYEKVEDDLIWIRMNGSLVGSGIGFILFVAISLWQQIR